MPGLSCPVSRPSLQEQLEGLLEEDRNRVLLLAGPPGSGKRTCARALGSRWLCQTPPPQMKSVFPTGCGQCHACLCIEAQTHPDWVEVFPEAGSTQIPVDRIRKEVCQTAIRSPQLGSYKVYILDADALSEIAQNILLKTLEEAGEAVRFLLLTAAPDRLLETVRSRALLLRLPPLTEEALLQVAREEGVVDTQRKRFALDYAQGNPGQFLQVLQSEDWWDEVQDLTLAWVHWMESEGTDQAQAWKELFNLLEERTQRQERLERSAWIWHLALQPPGWASSDLKRLSSRLGADLRMRSQRIRRILERLTETRQALEANVHAEMALTRLMLQIRKERQDA